jgi:MerR family transcriptional regulator/heat shock protein HspR
MPEVDENSPLFAIAMAAELSNMHPQTLRQYDRLGLVSPANRAATRCATSCSCGRSRG